MERWCSYGYHSMPAGDFKLNNRGIIHKACEGCRERRRIYYTGRGRPQPCPHGKAKGYCIICSPASALGKITRDRANDAFGTKLPMSTAQLLGCSTREFAFYILAKLRGGMTQENYGIAWQLDHVIPIMLRDADGNRPDQATILSRFQYTNVEPVLIEEHRAKTTAERAARWRAPPPPPPPPQLTDEELEELLAGFGIEL